MERANDKEMLMKWAALEQDNVGFSLAPFCPICDSEMSPMPGLGSGEPKVHMQGEPISSLDPSLGEYGTDCVEWKIAFICNEEACAAEITINHTMQMQFYGEQETISDKEFESDEPPPIVEPPLNPGNIINGYGTN